MKVLIEIFCQKLTISNVILAFLDYLKPKIVLSTNHGGQHRALPLLFKISGSAPGGVYNLTSAYDSRGDKGQKQGRQNLAS